MLTSFLIEDEDQSFVSYVNEQLEIAAQQDRRDPDDEPFWSEEMGDILSIITS